MEHFIIFDKENVNWENDEGHNLMFLRTAENHLKDLLNSRGYVYTNQIYEVLGIKWDPRNENQVWFGEMKHNYANIIGFFEIFPQQKSKERILIHILKPENKA